MNRWFHPNLGSTEAEVLLLERGEDGSFLVRPSRSCAGLSLSVRRRDKVTHIKIRQKGDFYDLHGGEQFATLPELIQYYTENQLKERNGEIFELKRPLISSDPTTERWFHGAISGSDAEKMLTERGVNGSFLVRASQSKIGDYVLTVRTKDESSQADKITHVMIRYNDEQKFDVGGGDSFYTLSQLVEYYRNNPMVEMTGSVVNMKYPFNTTRITALDIDARIRELSKPSICLGKEGFWEEFEHLQHQECKVLFNRKAGQEDRNMMKNRYKNILPYDYTRVILKRPTLSNNDDKNSETDYINANIIKLAEDDATISPGTKPVPHSKIYIATQGPLPNTVDDFWWMVWQEKTNCIVMVTKELERGKNKCYRYWPTPEQKILRSGPIEIRNILEKSHKVHEEDYAYRELELRYIGGDENNDCLVIRKVFHFQYYSWPDQNIPSDPSSVLNLLHDINQQKLKGPMIVHCSAGIGRSGTLIVIDMIMDQLKQHGLTYEIDIQRIVKTARAQRSGLVQTEAQYKFIYLAVQAFISTMTQFKDLMQAAAVQAQRQQQQLQKQQQQQHQNQSPDDVRSSCFV